MHDTFWPGVGEAVKARQRLYSQPPNPAGTPIRAGNSLGVSQLPNTPWNPTHAPAFMTLLFMTRRPQEERFCHPTQGTLCAFMLLALNCAT